MEPQQRVPQRLVHACATAEGIEGAAKCGLSAEHPSDGLNSIDTGIDRCGPMPGGGGGRNVREVLPGARKLRRLHVGEGPAHSVGLVLDRDRHGRRIVDDSCAALPALSAKRMRAERVLVRPRDRISTACHSSALEVATETMRIQWRSTSAPDSRRTSPDAGAPSFSFHLFDEDSRAMRPGRYIRDRESIGRSLPRPAFRLDEMGFREPDYRSLISTPPPGAPHPGHVNDRLKAKSISTSGPRSAIRASRWPV
jgi:hypothetical protein